MPIVMAEAFGHPVTRRGRVGVREGLGRPALWVERAERDVRAAKGSDADPTGRS